MLSGKKTGRRLLWSIVILYATQLSNSLVLTCCTIPGHCWTAKAHVVLTCINGVLPHLHSVTAESNRPWITLSTRSDRKTGWRLVEPPWIGWWWRWLRRKHSRNEMNYKSSYSQLSVEFNQFLLQRQQGSAMLDPKSPVWCKNLGPMLNLSGSVVNFVRKFANFSLSWQQGLVWHNFHFHS